MSYKYQNADVEGGNKAAAGWGVAFGVAVFLLLVIIVIYSMARFWTEGHYKSGWGTVADWIYNLPCPDGQNCAPPCPDCPDRSKFLAEDVAHRKDSILASSHVPPKVCIDQHDGFIFCQGIDSGGSDYILHTGKSIDDLKGLCMNDLNCVGFNQTGRLKSKIRTIKNDEIPNSKSGPTDGTYYLKPPAAPKYSNLGCWNDTKDRAFEYRHFPRYMVSSPSDIIQECANYADSSGQKLFAVQNFGTDCWVSEDVADGGYQKFGAATSGCTNPDGTGNAWQNNVYQIQ